jgi:hypothetical protein
MNTELDFKNLAEKWGIYIGAAVALGKLKIK